MHRSRKSIVTLAAALSGVLAMAGVAAAAHGSAKPKPKTHASTSGHHQRRRHGNTTTSVAGVTTTTKVEHANPEPGDDNGQDPAGHEVNQHVAAAATAATPAASSSEVGDDNGQDAAGHDANEADDANEANEANDDNGDDATTKTGATTTSVPDETTTTVATIPDGMQTFTVAGGTVTVDIEGGVLSLVSATPNAGFSVDKSEARSDRVEVEFRGSDSKSRVRVRVDDGRLRVETGDN